jgi:hypothetical protein
MQMEHHLGTPLLWMEQAITSLGVQDPSKGLGTANGSPMEVIIVFMAKLLE